MNRKFLATVMATIVIFALVGCGGKSTNENGGMTPSSDNIEATTEEYSAPASTPTPAPTSTPTATPEPTPEPIVNLEVGKRLGELVDLSAYNEIASELDVTMAGDVVITDVLPFEVFSIDSYFQLCNLDSPDGTKIVLSGSIPGALDTVMVVKMDNATTYDILVRMPYEANEHFNYCFLSDLGNFRVIASNLSKEQVEEMVYPEGWINPKYIDLIYNSTPDGRQTLGDFILRQQQEPKYFVFDPNQEAYVELTEETKMCLSQQGMVYAYFGPYTSPRENEDVTHVQTFFWDEIGEMTLEEVIETIKGLEITSTSRLVDNPFDTSAH